MRGSVSLVCLWCVWCIVSGCVRKPTLREVRQAPMFQRAAQAHQGLSGLQAPAACSGKRCRSVLAQQKTHFGVASQNYRILMKRDAKGLSGVLARCRLGDLHAQRMGLLRRLPAPNRSLLREEIVAKIKASFTKRGIAPGGQEKMLQRPKIKRGIAQNIEQWQKKRKSDIESVARRSELRARHHYKRCFEDAERHGELREHRKRAQRFLKRAGT